tara:strand:- start:56 stop:397 length:342 start_codon:yes stop_codon:yes gene_type:complete
MDNFNLKKYLAENKLLKETKDLYGEIKAFKKEYEDAIAPIPELGFGEAADSFLESFIESSNEEIDQYYNFANEHFHNWMKNLSDEEKIRAFENTKDWAEQKLSDLSKEGYKYV